ncbi:restriction endonuclease subunit S [Bradyrhizobium sp. SSUT77]|uniref:restriction endonuclease subunit S n=1 Tax=Bradyrhizobium sp. SSUT77 TaxID=3040603 RepID=UPI0024473619|nr:restriction endonuclease subunit S [Bradyrhizobium sp. SSUT77]MDH2345524.1 restriction endonuclease subunit S [Bradyrhizobium sp. SSUT77]
MSELWEDVTLEQVATDVTVGHVGPMADQYVETGVPFLRSLNVEPFIINTNDLKQISREFHLRLRKSALKPGDIVIVRTGKPGSCAVIPDWLPEANCSDVVVVRATPRVRPSFISFVVNSSAAHHIDAYTVGAVQQHFNVGSARKIRFRLPPIEEQDRILGVLGALNDKIELNRRMNETLEAAARAIFKDWFVDFGPTRAKLEGRAPYLAADIWPLFPDRLDDKGKPDGWITSTIGQEVEVVGGATPSTKDAAFWGGDISWATPKDLSSLSTPVLLSTERQITKAGLSQIGSGLLPVGTVLLSSRAPIGYMAIAQTPVAVNQGFIAMMCRKRLSDVFVWLWTQANMETVHQNANGSTFQEISKANFRPIEVTFATPDLLRVFDDTARPLFDRMVSNEKENRALAATRDFLLPKLMSGEVRVGDAKPFV